MAPPPSHHGVVWWFAGGFFSLRSALPFTRWVLKLAGRPLVPLGVVAGVAVLTVGVAVFVGRWTADFQPLGALAPAALVLTAAGLVAGSVAAAALHSGSPFEAPEN